MSKTGQLTEYIQSDMSLMRMLETTIREHWTDVAYTDYGTDVHFTFAEVAKEIKRLHLYFEDLGLVKGDKIAICDKNSSKWAVGYLAALTYGAITVPILNDFNGEQIVNILEHSDSKLLICGEAILKKVVDADEKLKAQMEKGTSLFDVKSEHYTIQNIVSIGTIPYDMPFAQADVRYFVENPDDLAMLSYTSGSTGHSKGVMIPYRAITSNIQFADEKLGLEHCTRLVSLLPMAHMYGFAFEFMYEFCIGTHVHFLTKAPSPSVLLKAFADVKPTIVIAVPLIIEKIVQGKIFPVIQTARMRNLLRIPFVSSIIYGKIRKRLLDVFGGQVYEVIVGGAAFNSDVEDFLRKIHFPYTVGYGMTECAPIICYRDWKTFVKSSCGEPAPRMEVKILSKDPENVPGEIVTRGTNVMLGYYKNPEATAEAIDKDGWLHTGDLGTKDKHGNVFIRGRAKNMLLGANGQNIYPEEIEEKLMSHALIDECVVVQREQKLYGLVYTSDDTLRTHGMTREDFKNHLDQYRRHVNSLLPTFYQLTALEARDEEFQKTPKRNIKRFLYT